ncbi:DUF4179 domain-containing protein [Clostridium sp. D46t1_190503_E9]|uniref:DUF4179 domain-containing protein n=1 Tax=Clostridium sp. D46t1_190503_E9 TaxID=2787137 RepID=UPI00189971A4|nr:DUF4179 domain-containing protein [Clostridium sp. D46t1_190503_E9]
MDDNFDKKLKEMARNSSIKEPWDMKELVNNAYKDAYKINKFSKYKKFIIAASVLIVCTVSFGIFANANAQEIPIISKVLEYFTKNNKIDTGYEGNTVEESYSASEDKYTVDIEDIYFDGRKLEFFYKIKSSEILDKSNIYYLNTTLKVNANIDATGGLEEKEFIDDYTYYGMISYGINSNSSETWPEILDGTITVNSIDIYNKSNNVESIQINKEPLKVNLDSKNINSKELLINKIISYNGLKSEVTKLTKFPTGITMDILNSNPWNQNSGVYFRTYLWDSKKGVLDFKDKTNDTSDNGIIIREEYENPSEDGELSIISFVSESGPIGNGEDRKVTYKIDEGVQLDLGNLGKVEVESIVNKEDRTIITMRTTGYISVEHLKVSNGDYNYLASEITNKEVYGDLDIKAEYIFPKLDKENGIYIRLYHTKILELLDSQTIRVNLSDLK